MKIIELNGKIVLVEGEEELGYLVFRRDEDRIIILSSSLLNTRYPSI